MNILIDLIFVFISGLISFFLYPFWIDFVYKFQMGEDIRKDGPQTHLIKQGTPTMGGLVFVLTVSLLTFALNRSRTQTLFPVFIASLAGLLGIIEDLTKVFKKSELPSFFDYYFGWTKKIGLGRKKITIFTPLVTAWNKFVDFWSVFGSLTDKSLATHQKFLIECLIAGFVAYWTHFKLGWDYIWFPLIGDVSIGLLYPLVIFILFIVILNAIAFTDGLDGLAGGLAFFSFVAFWVISRILGYNSLASFCATFAGAMIPFLYFNVYPARIFMGNVGSHVLGATLAILGVVMHREIALLIIVFVFLVDGVSSPLQSLSVKLTKKRLFRMAPIHHHFEVLGWPEAKVTFRFWIFGIIFAFIGIFVALL